MKHHLKRWVIHIAAAAAACGGCCNVSPNQEQIENWVRDELPRGSTRSDVENFTRRHLFIYSNDPSEDPRNVQIYRGLAGCESQLPVATIDITYDADGRLTDAQTNLFGRPIF